MRQAHDAQAANLQQAGQSGHGPGDAVLDVHAIIRHQIEAARKQTQEQVGLAGPGGPISSTPSPARLAQLPWICMTTHCGPVRGGKEARLVACAAEMPASPP